MYSETFNVRPWLEPACKWLRWAMQATQARKLEDAQYNLQQFWKSLESFKGRASTGLDWTEILVLDSQSQWALSNYYQARQHKLMEASNDYAGVKKTLGLLAPSNWLEWASGQKDARLEKYAAEVRELGRKAEQANQASRNLAEQAADASLKAGVKTQAGNMKQIADWNATKLRQENASAERIENRIREDANTPPNPFTLDFFGLPVWAWGAIGLAAVLLLMPSAPRVSFSTGGRR